MSVVDQYTLAQVSTFESLLHK